MGHVDHGKTSLLDAIRSADVAAHERVASPSTSGAYQIVKNTRKIVFIDTPGHEAFTRMRARGAKVTDGGGAGGGRRRRRDAADQGSDCPRQGGRCADCGGDQQDRQTRCPGGPHQAAVDRIRAAGRGLGRRYGDGAGFGPRPDQHRPVARNDSAGGRHAGPEGQPDAAGHAGSVLEAQLDRGRGPVATVLVRNGTLGVGDFFICGSVFGKVAPCSTTAARDQGSRALHSSGGVGVRFHARGGRHLPR